MNNRYRQVKHPFTGLYSKIDIVKGMTVERSKEPFKDIKFIGAKDEPKRK